MKAKGFYLGSCLLFLGACSSQGDYQTAIKAFDSDSFPWKVEECANVKEFDLSAVEYDKIYKRGWNITVQNDGKPDLIAKAGSPVVSARVPVPLESSKLQFSALLQGTEVGGAVLVDVIFYAKDKEVGRAVLQSAISETSFEHLRDMATVPLARPDLVELQVRPWREQDGSVTLRKARAAWCMAALPATVDTARTG